MIPIERDEAALRRQRNMKWRRYDGDVLPAWIAETDLRVAPPIQAAVARLAADEDYGYPLRDGRPVRDAVAAAFARRMEDRFGWKPDPAQVQLLTSLDQGIAAVILAFTDPGDGIVVQTPCYPPFRETIAEAGRRLISHPLVDAGEGYRLDIAGLDALIEAGGPVKALLLCNPNNPTGHVFTRDELEALAAFAVRHDLIVISDEVHADFVFDGRRHLPMGAIGAQVAARCLTLNSASKSFNIPGLRCGVLHLGSPDLAARFARRMPAALLGEPSVFGIDALIAAWTEGQPALDRITAHLQLMRDRLAEAVTGIDGLRMHRPEATFLAWIDCSGLRLNTTAYEFVLERCGIAAMPGEMFEPGAHQFVRVNYATSAPMLDRMIAGLRAGVARHRSGPGAVA